MYCPKCGSENRDDARFCARCGAALDGVGNVRRAVSRDRSDQMCFGLTGGTLRGLVIGAIIIIVGVTSVFGQNFGQGMGRWGRALASSSLIGGQVGEVRSVPPY